MRRVPAQEPLAQFLGRNPSSLLYLLFFRSCNELLPLVSTPSALFGLMLWLALLSLLCSTLGTSSYPLQLTSVLLQLCFSVSST